MVDPHKQNRVTRDHYYQKTAVGTRLFALLDWAVEDRDMTLIPHLSRAVRRGDILELATTDEVDLLPGQTVQRVAYIGFVEVVDTGLILNGDQVKIGKETVGTVIGFDETHMPNHLNLVLQVEKRQTGREMDVKLDAHVVFSGIHEEDIRRIGFEKG